MTEEQQGKLIRKVMYSLDQTHKMDEAVRDLTLVYRENLTDIATDAEHLAITEMLPAMIGIVQAALFEIETRIRNTKTTETKGE